MEHWQAFISRTRVPSWNLILPLFLKLVPISNMHFPTISACILSSLAATVSAHGYVDNVTVAGVTYIVNATLYPNNDLIPLTALQ
jgi:hypothetical protein